jgi:mono/diheme cytochrome c family protein
VKRSLTLVLALAASLTLVGCQPAEEEGAETAPPAAESPVPGESPAAEGAAPAGQQVAGVPAGVDAAAGQQIYATNCATCHGDRGLGDGPAAPALNPRPTNLAQGPYRHGGTFDEWVAVVKNGIPGTAMAPWAGTLTEEQIRNVVAYELSLKQ